MSLRYMGDPTLPWSPSNADGFFVPTIVEAQAGAPVYAPQPSDAYFLSHPRQLLTPQAQAVLQKNAADLYTASNPMANAGANIEHLVASPLKDLASGAWSQFLKDFFNSSNPKKPSDTGIWGTLLIIAGVGIAGYLIAEG